MFKTVKNLVWAFDAEWVPDPVAGRLLYGLSEESSDAEVMKEMWKQGGASEEDPTPYLKTILCRMVSIAAIQRHAHKDGRITLNLLSLPRTTDDAAENQVACGEANIINTFLQALGERKPQLVGYNSLGADLRILVQRAITLGLRCPKFAMRPGKPWEGVDYFIRNGDYHIDLKDYATPGWGSGSPSLHELATLSGIPGKLDTSGEQVPAMWLDGKLDEIIAYNECDALTTYLVWLRMAHFTGHFNSVEYAAEQARLKKLIQQEEEKRPHLNKFLQAWDKLSSSKTEPETHNPIATPL